LFGVREELFSGLCSTPPLRPVPVPKTWHRFYSESSFCGVPPSIFCVATIVAAVVGLFCWAGVGGGWGLCGGGVVGGGGGGVVGFGGGVVGLGGFGSVFFGASMVNFSLSPPLPEVFTHG